MVKHVLTAHKLNVRGSYMPRQNPVFVTSWETMPPNVEARAFRQV